MSSENIGIAQTLHADGERLLKKIDSLSDLLVAIPEGDELLAPSRTLLLKRASALRLKALRLKKDAQFVFARSAVRLRTLQELRSRLERSLESKATLEAEIAELVESCHKRAPVVPA